MDHPHSREGHTIPSGQARLSPAPTEHPTIFPFWTHHTKPTGTAAAATVQAAAHTRSKARPVATPRPGLWRHLRWWLLLPAVLYGLYRFVPWPGHGLQVPVGTAFRLSGNFGELRPQHFHMGLDVRTDGKGDLPVYAVADGYISRVLIEEFGLGKALFVTHPNGTTTVYAHLNRFYDAVQTTVEATQRQRQQRAMDQAFAAGRFPVTRGQRIALSGNTGGSEAPHLHFEIRDSRTGHNLNPLQHGYGMDDDTPPQLTGLYWYNRRYSTYRMAANAITIQGEAGRYQPARPVIKVRSPLISLGVQATDRSNDSRFRLGVYRTVTELDGKVVHESTLDELAPENSRFINACIDYPRWVRTGRFVQHLATLPGNELPAWKGKGLLDLSDGKEHDLQISLYDVNGNKTVFSGRLQYAGAIEVPPANEPGTILIAPGKARSITATAIKVNFTSKAFYDTAAFVLKERTAAPQAVSVAVGLHTASVPVHDRYTVALRPRRPLTEAARRQVVMQLNTGKKRYTARGQWQGEWLRASFDELGTVQLVQDQQPPQVSTAGWSEGQTFSGDAITLPLVCVDDLGGIASFRATLNGQWLLYENKGKDFVVKVPANCKAGRHQVVITATDIAGNTTTRTIAFHKAG